VALSFFKAKAEEPWDRFSRTMNRALDAASVEIRNRHGRRLRLGSPVLMSDTAGDLIRTPVELRGGQHEFSVLYLEIRDLANQDSRRIDAIARQAVEAAQPYVETPPEKPGALVVSYP
jgi:outer membrane lipopolysaccharide assembly protein LptE/RlpB